MLDDLYDLCFKTGAILKFIREKEKMCITEYGLKFCKKEDFENMKTEKATLKNGQIKNYYYFERNNSLSGKIAVQISYGQGDICFFNKENIFDNIEDVRDFLINIKNEEEKRDKKRTKYFI